MSDKPISKGDLVMVVRAPHHCFTRYLGRPGTVTEMSTVGFGDCLQCGERVTSPGAPVAVIDGIICLHPAWLKRIDPDNLLDDVPASEELTA